MFSKPKLVLWPHKDKLEAFYSSTKNNYYSLEIDLFKASSSDLDLLSLQELIKLHPPSSVTVLLPEDVVVTKSFTYDTNVTNIDREEVIKLAHTSVNFEINPEALEYALIQQNGKTIIQADIFDKNKLINLQQNLAKLALKKFNYESVAKSSANLISRYYKEEYFLLLEHQQEYTLVLAKGPQVFLTNKLKSSQHDIQKLINYSKLYFDKTINRLFLDKSNTFDLTSTTGIEKNDFDTIQIATQQNLPTTLPLPVLGVLLPKTVTSSNLKLSTPMTQPETTNFDETIITPVSNKKNSLAPILIVGAITALLVSGLVYYSFSKANKSTAEVTPTPTVEVTPTVEPTATPTLAPVDKKIKIQVQNATDINGQAASLKETITKLGFTSVATGNSKEDVTENIIRTKKKLSGMENYFTQMMPSFSATFEPTLSDTGTYDVVFIIGTDLSTGASTATPTTATKSATPTPTE